MYLDLLRGGHNYPWLVRNTPRKPLKVFLQDGAQDINNQHGSWPLANQELAAALEYAGYDFRFEYVSAAVSRCLWLAMG